MNEMKRRTLNGLGVDANTIVADARCVYANIV